MLLAALDPRRPTGLTEVAAALEGGGHEHVAGLDEARPGGLGGPVTVGVALVRPGVRRNSMPRWLRDSKLLAEDRREDFVAAGFLVRRWGSVMPTRPMICFGMTAALRLASLRALEELGSTTP